MFFVRALVTIICALTVWNAYAEEVIVPNPNTELKAAVDFLPTVPDDARPYIRFFTTAFIPDNKGVTLKINDKLRTLTLRDATVLCLDFWIHSISYGDVVSRVKPVSGSETLFFVDIRQYNWTAEAFEKISAEDPYFRRPWIEKGAYDALKIQTGNSILRADWFIYHLSDTSKQVDLNRTPLYYELLYSTTGIPKTINEFQKIWFVDEKEIDLAEVLTGVVVDKGESGVARHNRQLFRARTIYGSYNETNDVKNMEGGRDYVESLQTSWRRGKDVDAGEAITHNKLKLQVYFFFNSEGKRIEEGEVSVAIDNTDPHDPRVRMVRSCIICHPKGLNVPNDALKDILSYGIEIRSKDYYKDKELKRFFFSDYTTTLGDDNILYERAMKRVNGLSPEDNVKLYREVMTYYERDVDLNQAALETGQSIETLQNKAASSIRGRIDGLIKGNKPIPREVWDNRKNGAFAELMLHLYNLEPIISNDEPVQKYVLVTKECDFKMGEQVLARIPVKARLAVLDEKDGWLKVQYDNKLGWIYQNNVSKE